MKAHTTQRKAGKATTTRTDTSRQRYVELKRILEERRREILAQVQEKMRDVRAEGGAGEGHHAGTVHRLQLGLKIFKSTRRVLQVNDQPINAVVGPQCQNPNPPFAQLFRKGADFRLQAGVADGSGGIPGDDVVGRVASLKPRVHGFHKADPAG